MDKKAKETLVGELSESLSDSQLKLFVIILVERQFRTYKKYAAGKAWDFTDKFNNIIEDCWDCVINGTEYDYMMELENSDNYFEDYEEWEEECDMHSPKYLIDDYSYGESIEVLTCIVQSIYILYPSMAESRNHRSQAEQNFDFLHQFFYHTDDEVDFEEHELVCLEFEREKRDIEYLKTEKDLQKIYQRYHFDLQENILEDYCLDESISYTYDKQRETESGEAEQEFDKNMVEFYYKYGCIYTELGRYEEAAKFFTEVIDLEPNNVEAYNGRAFASMCLKEYQKAIDDLNKAITFNPNYERAYHNLGVVYHELEKYEESIFYYNKQIELNPNAENAYLGRSNSYTGLGEHQKSVEDLTKAIELKPDFAEAYCNRAYNYNELKEYQKAICDCDKAEAQNPNLGNIYSNRGNSYYGLGEYQKAIDDYSTAIALEPNDKETYLNRAKAYHAIGEKEKAIADENRAKEID